ncbi:MAG: hypothetical protein H0V66_05630 [Bdellovibrionales bacterium]|nr:hypothetical protein [Bdellovibrionales bacterium]
MNLAESMKHVLKTKSQNIFGLLIKEDFKNIIKDFAGEIVTVTQKRKKTFRNFSLKESVLDVKDSVASSILLIKAIPNRVSEGFRIFSQEMMNELDKLPDQKQKTVFCMKVLAGMSKFALSSAYDVGLGEAKLLGLGKPKNIVANVIVSKLLFKTIKSLIIRLIEEMEKEISNPEELLQLQSYKDIVMDDSGNAIDKFFDGVTDANDRAFAIVENLKKYILTGEQV